MKKYWQQFLDWFYNLIGKTSEPSLSPMTRIRGIGFAADWDIRDNSYIEDARKSGCNTIMIEYGGTRWDSKTIDEFRQLRGPFKAFVRACKRQGMMPWIALLNGNDPMSSRFSASDIAGEVAWMNDVLREEGCKEAVLTPVLEWPNGKSGGISESKARGYHAACEQVWSFKLAWNKDSRPKDNPANYHYRDWHPESVDDNGRPGPNQVLHTDHGVTGRQLGVNKGGYPNEPVIKHWVQLRESRGEHWIIFTHIRAPGHEAHRPGADKALFSAIRSALK